MIEKTLSAPSAGEALPVGESFPATAPGSVGQRLRAAREARNMSVADAAQSLKLAPRQVEAIEAENWASLPGNTMIRGFVRNYARVLNLDGDELMRALDAAQLQRTLVLDVSAGTSASLPHPSNRVERRDYLAILAGLAVLALALLAYFFVPPDFWQAQLTVLTGGSKAEAPSEAPPPASEATAGGLAAGAVSAPTTPNTTLLADLAPGTARQPGAVASGDGLKFTFAQPAWVEVRDARGQVLLAELGAAGSQRVVDGQAPFSLVVGNATQVSVQYRGKLIDLGTHNKGDVARLKVE